MSFAETAVLGAIAGSTIFLGLPLGRAGWLSMRARVGLRCCGPGSWRSSSWTSGRRPSGLRA